MQTIDDGSISLQKVFLFLSAEQRYISLGKLLGLLSTVIIPRCFMAVSSTYRQSATKSTKSETA